MPFVVFEGGEGVGKSTQMSLLAKALEKSGLQVLCTREPGGTPLAECLRQIFKESVAERDHPTPWAELLIVAAARAQHLEKVLRPLRQAGTWILCDRFLDSAFVYQGIRGHLGIDAVNQIHRPFLTDSDLPDLTIVLDLPTGASQARLQIRPEMEDPRQGDKSERVTDRLDTMSSELHEKVREGFRTLIETKAPYPSGKTPKRILIDASGSPEAVATQIEQNLKLQGLWPEGRS